MENVIHYIWKHRILEPELYTTDGEKIEVIDPGIHNRDEGPDFFNAKIKIGGTMWAGNVEIHEKASDWYRHSGCETTTNTSSNSPAVPQHPPGCCSARAPAEEVLSKIVKFP